MSTYARRITSFPIIATWYQSFYKQLLQCCLEPLDCVAINNFRRKSNIYPYQSQCTSTLDFKEVPVFDIHKLAIMPAASWSCAMARLWIFKRIVENGLGLFPTLFDAALPTLPYPVCIVMAPSWNGKVHPLQKCQALPRIRPEIYRLVPIYCRKHGKWLLFDILNKTAICFYTS